MEDKVLEFKIIKTTHWVSKTGSNERTFVLKYTGDVFILSTLEIAEEYLTIKDNKKLIIKCEWAVKREKYTKDGLEKEGLHIVMEGPSNLIEKDSLFASSHENLIKKYTLPISINDLIKDGYTVNVGLGKYSAFLKVSKLDKANDIFTKPLESYVIYPSNTFYLKEDRSYKSVLKIKEQLNNIVINNVNKDNKLVFDLASASVLSDSIIDKLYDERKPLSIAELLESKNYSFTCKEINGVLAVQLTAQDFVIPKLFWISKKLNAIDAYRSVEEFSEEINNNPENWMLTIIEKDGKEYHRIYKRKIKNTIKNNIKHLT